MPAEFELRVAAVAVAREISVIVALAITAPVLSAVSPRMRPLLTAVCAIAPPEVNAIKRHPNDLIAETPTERIRAPHVGLHPQQLLKILESKNPLPDHRGEGPCNHNGF
jgi:hypothetical protein